MYDVQPAPESRDEYEAALRQGEMSPQELTAWSAWMDEQEKRFMVEQGFDPFKESPEEFWARIDPMVCEQFAKPVGV